MDLLSGIVAISLSLMMMGIVGGHTGRLVCIYLHRKDAHVPEGGGRGLEGLDTALSGLCAVSDHHGEPVGISSSG